MEGDGDESLGGNEVDPLSGDDTELLSGDDTELLTGDGEDLEDTEIETDDGEETEEDSDPNNLKGAEEREQEKTTMEKHAIWIIPVAVVGLLIIIFVILGVVCCRMNKK